jgi:hypothetical protein
MFGVAFAVWGMNPNSQDGFVLLRVTLHREGARGFHVNKPETASVPGCHAAGEEVVVDPERIQNRAGVFDRPFPCGEFQAKGRTPDALREGARLFGLPAFDVENYKMEIKTNDVGFEYTYKFILVLSKFPISDNEFTVFGNGAGWDWFASKGFHKTRFTTPFGDFVSFFTHTQSDETYSATRKKQLQQMRNHMSDLEVPSIIVGDLNIIGESDEYYDILKSVFPDYQDSYRKSNPNNPGYTYNSATNHLAHYYCSSNDYQQRLDYILFSSGWTAHSSKVIEHCRYYSESLKANASCSDHYGLESQLILIKNTVFPFRSNLAKSYQEALKKIDHLKARYGTGLTAKILIHNKTDKTLTFKSKATWYNSTFFNSPPNIPPGEYGLILASHDTGEATGVYNQLTYLYNNQKISFGTYVPWSWVYTNNVLVDFKEIDYNNLYYNSTRPWIYRKSAGLGITGSISTGDSPYVRFTVEKK